ncbi:MAG: CrcB family protein [Planctomycetes bacterium]|nr:CrcB family protein [Planctomycetota bacterium]
MSFTVCAAIAAAGALGAVSRFLLTELVRSLWGTFPLSTLVVNLLGCFLFGLGYELGHGRWSPIVQAAVLTGFLGAFTTFSTFAFDCRVLIQEQRWLPLGANVVLQNVLGVLAVFGGAAVASSIRGGV